MDDAASLIAKLLTHCTPNAVVPAQYPLKEFSGIAFVGIGPGEVEVSEGTPFAGPSGRIFNACLQAVGIDREACWVGNLCPVRLAQDRGLARHEVAVLREPLIQSMRELQPRLIIPLGAEPTRAFLFENDVEIMLMRSHVYESPDIPGAHIMPSIHPAYALRQSLALGAYLLNDFLIAKKFLGGVSRYRPWTYEEITSIDHLQEVLWTHKDELMALDSEATDKNPFHAIPFMLSFAFEGNPDHGYVIHTPHECYSPAMGRPELLDGRQHATPLERVFPIMQKFGLRTVIQNMLYDYILLSRYGYTPEVHADTMYAFSLLDENCPRGLETLGSFFSGIGPYSIDYNSNDLSVWKPYAACDAVNTIRVWKSFEPRFFEPRLKWLLLDYIMPLLAELAHIATKGIFIDTQKLADIDRSVQDEILKKIQLLQATAGMEFNHRSSAQLTQVFEKLRIPILGRSRKTKKPSFRKEVMDKLKDRYPFVELLQETKKMEKLHSSYVKNIHKFLDPENVVHPNFDIKKTGRLSASEPAVQTLPRKSAILAMYAARPGHIFIKCDFSAAELRWLGFLAGEERWLNPSVDLHVSNAAFFYRVDPGDVSEAMRTEVKFLGFGKVYGSGIETLAKQLKCSFEQAQVLEDKFFQTFPKVKDYMDHCQSVALSQGYLANYFGLERHFAYDIMFGDLYDEHRIIREAYNFGPQSTVAMWTNMSLVKVQKWLRSNLPDSRVVLQIHDAIVVEAPVKDIYKAMFITWTILRRTIDEKTKFFLPVDISIGPDLLHQVKVIPFYEDDFDVAYEKFSQSAQAGTN
jgi:DNA polymerase-1